LRFVIAGSLQGRQTRIEEAVEALPLPRGEGRIPLPDERPAALKKPLYIENATVDNLYFYIDTFVLRKLQDPEWDALQLLNIMLTETLHSRILGEARERGLVYDMGSGLSQTRDNVAWWFGALVLPQNVEALFEIINHELRAVLEGYLSEDDLVAAQSYAIGRFQRSGQTVGGVANGYSGRYFFEDVVDDYYKIPERIKSVTKEAIIEAARTMFAADLWGIGVLGSCGEAFSLKLQKQLNGLWAEVTPQVLPPAPAKTPRIKAATGARRPARVASRKR
jgi:predicted Zn-dependent peptidase